jgi:hypothetical protein
MCFVESFFDREGGREGEMGWGGDQFLVLIVVSGIVKSKTRACASVMLVHARARARTRSRTQIHMHPHMDRCT